MPPSDHTSPTFTGTVSKPAGFQQSNISRTISTTLGSSSASTGSSNTANGYPSATPTTRTQFSGSMLILFTTSYDAQASSFTSIPPGITINTAIRISDGKHPVGLYPLIRGCPSCFFCPPGIDLGGLILWGMSVPGVSTLDLKFQTSNLPSLAGLSSPCPPALSRNH